MKFMLWLSITLTAFTSMMSFITLEDPTFKWVLWMGASAWCALWTLIWGISLLIRWAENRDGVNAVIIKHTTIGETQ